MKYKIGAYVAVHLIVAYLIAALAAPSLGAFFGFLILPALAVGRGMMRDRRE